MADSITSKNQSRTQLREIQQEKNYRKSELAAQEREDLKNLKSYYSEERKKIDQESSAAVNHIKSEQNNIAQQEQDLKKQERQDRLDHQREEGESRRRAQEERSASASTYNRQGQLQSPPDSPEKKSF